MNLRQSKLIAYALIAIALLVGCEGPATPSSPTAEESNSTAPPVSQTVTPVTTAPTIQSVTADVTDTPLPDPSGLLCLTQDPGSDRDPAWSPDGERVAFVSDRSGAFEVYSMTYVGEDVVRHTQDDGINFKWSPTWSPDGEHIAFSALFDVYQIHVLDVEDSYLEPFDVLGDFVRPLTNRVWNSEDPAWSPDGDRIAFTTEDPQGQSQIHFIYIDDGRKQQLTTFPVPSRRAAWAPDAAKLAFESNASGDYEIYVVRADGTGVQRLTQDPAFDAWPSWSPDGQSIVFSSNRDGALGLYVMRSDGSDVRKLEIGTGDAAEPAWSPDGRFIAFVSNRDGNDEIYRIDAPDLSP